MLGRSARGNRKPGPDYPTETRSPHRSAYNRRRSGPRHRRTKRKRDRPYRHYPRYPSHCGGCPQQALEAITKGNEAERGQGQFTTLRVSEGKARERSLPSGSQSLQTINCELCILNCELTLSRLRGKLEYATGGNAERWREKVFGPAMAYRAKHRRSAVRAEAPPCGGSQNLQIPVLNGARPADFGTRTFAPPVDRVGQKAGAGISAEPKPQAGCDSRNYLNCKTAENPAQNPPQKQLFL